MLYDCFIIKPLFIICHNIPAIVHAEYLYSSGITVWERCETWNMSVSLLSQFSLLSHLPHSQPYASLSICVTSLAIITPTPTIYLDPTAVRAIYPHSIFYTNRVHNKSVNKPKVLPLYLASVYKLYSR